MKIRFCRRIVEVGSEVTSFTVEIFATKLSEKTKFIEWLPEWKRFQNICMI